MERICRIYRSQNLWNLIRWILFWLILPNTPAFAADAIVAGQGEAYATIQSIGLIVAYQGDDNTNATAQLEYRERSATAWQKGHSLMRISGRRFAGSLFDLRAETEYELRVEVQDPDGGGKIVSLSTKTRADKPPASPTTGRHLYVDAVRGNDAQTGQQNAPLATLQEAAKRINPGDTVHVLPGVYRGTVMIDRKGTITQPITFLAEGQGVILDGSDPTIANNPAWRAEGDGIYSTPFTTLSTYLASGNLRLYDYDQLNDLKAENGRQIGKNGLIKGGFFVDQTNKRLYLRLPDRSDPSKAKIFASIHEVGFFLYDTSDIIVRGFEIRYFSRVGIDVRNTTRSWIQQNTIHHINGGIEIRKASSASENVIEDNHITDNGPWLWDWASVKAHTAEASGISVTHGRGNIVRRNRIEGIFNGVYVGSFSDTDDLLARDTDVYDNKIQKIGDDGLEPEGACVNVRFVRNHIQETHNGVSLAPIRIGPTWVIRTLVAGFKAHALKLNNGSTGWMLIYHTTALPTPNTDAQPIAPSVPFGFLVTRNNLWFSERYVIEHSLSQFLGPVDMDYDLFWSTRPSGEPRIKWKNVRYNDLRSFQQATQLQSHGVEALPRFVNEALGDYRPAAASAMIDKGQRIDGINTTQILGAAPDIGAFESGTPLPPQESTTEPTVEPTTESSTPEPTTEPTQTEPSSEALACDGACPESITQDASDASEPPSPQEPSTETPLPNELPTQQEAPVSDGNANQEAHVSDGNANDGGDSADLGDVDHEKTGGCGCSQEGDASLGWLGGIFLLLAYLRLFWRR